MKKIITPTAFFLLSFLVISCGPDNKVMLFNGDDLENWNIFVSSSEVAPDDLFWVEDGMINTSGKPHGYIRTKDVYSNYKLHVEWRWSQEPTNSGVMIHVHGNDMVWPHCIECQLKHGQAGDLVLMGKGTGVTVRDSTFLITWEERRYTSVPKFEGSSEKPAGEWNSYDITTLDGDLEVIVNGILQHSGTKMTLSEGNIVLQSEGSPIQFRNIYLEPL
ncbi:MAG: DUF1080 domain-containing protein [Bacteroidetes bacterium]|nr:MAG: DUF1080 domain-containing protein [Bacteroidota bacterium]